MTELSSYSDSELMAIAGKSQGVDAAILKQESGNNPNAPTSIDGAIGQSQIIPATFARFAQPGEDIHNEADNLAVGQRYRDYLSKRFNGDPARIATAYFSGEGNVAPLDSQTPWLKDKADGNGKMVSSYVSDIMKKISPVSEAVASESAAPELSDDELKKIAGISDQSAKPDTFDTVADNALQGATFGLGNRAAAGLAALVESGINGQPLADNYKKAREVGTQRIADESSENPLTAILANLGGALATGGLGAGTKTGAAIGDSLGSGNAISRVAKGALAGAASGGLYGAGTAEYDKAAEGAKQGAVFGGLVGGAIPAAGTALGGIKNAIAPTVDKAIQPLASRAKELGIPLRVDQVSPTRARRTLQKVSQELPLSGTDAFEGTQRQAWNSAVAKTIGQNADNLGPETIGKFLEDASSKFEAIVQHADIKTNTKSLDALQNIANQARDNITKDYADIVVNKANNIANQLFQSRQLPNSVEYTSKQLNGKKLASVRSQLVKSLPNVAGDARKYVAEIVDVIDDIAKNNLASDDIKKLEIARREWRNFKTIEPLLEKSTDGLINPTELLNRVKTTKFIKASRAVVGEDDLVDLARIGKEFLVKPGGSDTAQKIGLGAAGASLLYDPLMGGSVLATLGGNRAFQGGYNSNQRIVESILKNSNNPAIGKSPLLSLLNANAGGAISGQKSIRIGLKKVPSKSIQP